MQDCSSVFSLYDHITAAVIVLTDDNAVFYTNKAAEALAETEGTTVSSLLSDGHFSVSKSPFTTGGNNFRILTVTKNTLTEENEPQIGHSVVGTLKIIRKALRAGGVELFRVGSKIRRKAYSSDGNSIIKLPSSILIEAEKLLPSAPGSYFKLSDNPALGDLFCGRGIYDCLFGRIFPDEFIICFFRDDRVISPNSCTYFSSMCRYLSSTAHKSILNNSDFASAAKLAALNDNSSIVTIMLDRDLNILDLSGNGLESVTRNPKRLIGQSLYELSYPPRALEIIEQAFTKPSGTAALHLGERHFDAYYSSIISGGESIGLFAVLTDMTDKTSHAYDSSNIGNSMDIVAFSMRSGFWSLDLSTKTHIWDEGCYHLWGLRPNEIPITDEALEQIFPPGDNDRLRAVIAQTMSDPGATYFHFKHSPVIIDNEPRYIECRGKVLWENGEPVKIVGMNTDITESIELEEKLEYESDQNLTLMNISIACAYSENISDAVQFTVVESARLLESSAAALYVADEENKVWKSIFTWRDGEYESELAPAADINFEDIAPFEKTINRRRTCTILSSGDHNARLFPSCGGQSVVSMVSDEADTRSMLWFGHAESSSAWSDAETDFILTASGVLRMALKRGKMESDLRRAVDAAEAGNKAKSDFLSQMSHEIRTPMNAVLGMSRIAMDSENLSEIKTCLKNVESSGMHLLGIINDILDISKIEAGKMELDISDFSLPDLISEVSNMMGFAAADKGLLFVRKISAGIPKTLRSDSKRLRQVLINLLNNAIKFTREGQITLDISANGNLLLIKVSDTGIGIKDDERHKLFGAFEQLDRAANRSVGGTGLGLMITKSIVELMNGTITFESVYGEGTTFIVELPYEQSTSDIKPQVNGSNKKLSTSGVRALVVDDNSINLLVAVGILKKYGMQCDSATNALSAVKLAEENEYDIIFMDHMMSEIGGIEATAMIRALGEKYTDLPVVALTANAIVGGREMFISHGLNDYISKPIGPHELDQLLLRQLPPEKIRFI